MNNIDKKDFDIVVSNLGMIYKTNYSQLVVLKNINFKIRKGSIFCLLGPSGCGKSTLLKILLGLIKETSGKIEAIIDRIENRIEEYYLRGFENKLPNELSGGMKQRVDIIRALESDADLMFCDEPFSAVDFVSKLELTARFKKMCHLKEKTTVLVTHNIEEAIFLGDTVAVMSGQPAEIVFCEPTNLAEYDDPIECRETERFRFLFRNIWDKLKSNYETRN